MAATFVGSIRLRFSCLLILIIASERENEIATSAASERVDHPKHLPLNKFPKNFLWELLHPHQVRCMLLFLSYMAF